MIFVWHHAEGKPPGWDVPQIPYLDDPAWSPVRLWEAEVPVHIQDMAENNLDPVHFEYVHKMTATPDTEISLEEDGRVMHAVSYSTQETPLGAFDMQLVRKTWCIGLASVESSGIPGVGLYMFTSTTPIDRDHTISAGHSRRRTAPSTSPARVDGGAITKGLSDDYQIWTNKIHRADPVLCEADTLLVEFRRWVKQFYSSEQT
ncbi:MAG: hypothetical protein R3E53_03930 [Myxococcota bacterium]